MTSADQAPTGLSRRRRRISDKETEKRMLDAAVAMVKRAGLTVSLEHILLEDVIREAGVSRSAVYRRWPYKDLFFSDLLRELAKNADPAPTAENEAIGLIRRLSLDRLDWLETPERRHQLVLEIVRQAALRDFEKLQELTEWRTYIALHATFLSLPDSDLRDEVQEALANGERTLIDRVATRYRDLAGLFGYRLRPDVQAGYETIASLVSAVVRGLLVMAPTTPSVVTDRIQGKPFGATDAAGWSQPALGTASVVFAFIEPDPTVEWTEERITTVREALTGTEMR